MLPLEHSHNLLPRARDHVAVVLVLVSPVSMPRYARVFQNPVSFLDSHAVKKSERRATLTAASPYPVVLVMGANPSPQNAVIRRITDRPVIQAHTHRPVPAYAFQMKRRVVRISNE